MLEVEMKFYTSDVERVRERLKELKAEFVKREKQVDIYFNHPCRDFGKTDEALRLRIAGEKTEITYKGRKIDKTTKTREEISTEVEDIKAMREILERLGFKAVREVVKHREVYSAGKFTVMVDSVEGLGDFVEIESTEYSPEEIIEFAEKIGLTIENAERKSYLELLLEAEK